MTPDEFRIELETRAKGLSSFGMAREAIELYEQAIARVLSIAAELRRTEACAASCIEGQSCTNTDARWLGRELRRVYKDGKGQRK